MTTSKRDDSLDIMKGLGCIFMVIAHQPYFTRDPDLALGLINHIAGAIPPALFFAIAGVTASFQAAKYSLPSLIKYFMAMFFLGITWNIAVHGDLSSFYWPEIFQLIALGSLGVCVVERKGPAPQPTLFLVGTSILLIKPVVKMLWPDVDGWNFLFCDTDYVPEIDSSANSVQILPGFPLFPWAGYFFLGAWCYRTNKRLKLTMSIGSLCLVFLSVVLGSSAIEKWDSSIAYILACCTTIFSFFWLFDGYTHAVSALAEQLRKIGSNAFLFFFSHPFGLVAGVILYSLLHNAYIAWAISIAVSVLAYNLFNRLKPLKLFESQHAWLAAIGAIILIPFLPQLIEYKSMPIVTRLLAIAIGIIAAINISSLSNLTKIKKPSRQGSSILYEPG